MATLPLRRLFQVGDIDGFFALGLEHFIQILLIVSLCQTVLSFPPNLVYGRILPGVGISVLASNLFYGWLTYQQNQQQGRTDMTALPSGVNLISLLTHVFLIMLPVRTAALAQGASPEAAAELAWQAGIVACFSSGVIKLLGLGTVNILRRSIPLAAQLSTLAGIALTFIAMGFVLRTFAFPVVALVPLGVILLTFFAQVQFAIPGGFLAILLGTVLAWATGFMHWDLAQLQAALQPLGLHPPQLWLSDLWQGRGLFLNYISVIVPLAIFDFLSSLQSMESADVVGDSYPRLPSMAAHGAFSVIGGICGSCFPVMIYIGHPGWKAMGAGGGYSLLSGLFAGLLALSGSALLLSYFVPIEAGMAIFIAIAICIVSQSFTAPPQRHAPAVVMGLFPGLAAWGALVAKDALYVSGMGTAANPFSPELLAQFQQHNLFIQGAFALERGYILIAIALSSMTVYIIDQQFRAAGIWALVAAALSWIGLIHSYQWTTADTVGYLQWGAGSAWAVGYGLLAILLFYTHWTVKKRVSADPLPVENQDGLETTNSFILPNSLEEP